MRNSSGLSCVLGINKPVGLSSHDVVNRARKVFGERRVGHTGTLDPAASGVLPLCIGPATRLDQFMTGHDKSYRVRIAFGAQTDTDDAAGEIIQQAEVPAEVFDPSFALGFVASLVGEHMQVPPQYSALKRNGVKACDAARAGKSVEFEPRLIQIYSATLVEVDTEGTYCPYPSWVLDVSVSKGTYIRSLARDIGEALNTCAHVSTLKRIAAGALDLDHCIALDDLSEASLAQALNPLSLLKFRVIVAEGALQRIVDSGAALKIGHLDVMRIKDAAPLYCKDSSQYQDFLESDLQPFDEGECIALVTNGSLKGIFKFDPSRNLLVPATIFSQGVLCGISH